MKRLSCWQLVPFLQPSSTMQITRDAFIDSLEASRVELSWCNPFCIFRRAVGTVGADDKLVVNGRLMDGCSTAKTSSSCHGVVRRSFLYINFNVLLLLLLLLLLAVYGLPPFWNSASINTRAEPRRGENENVVITLTRHSLVAGEAVLMASLWGNSIATTTTTRREGVESRGATWMWRHYAMPSTLNAS